jgi:hypothetical protein
MKARGDHSAQNVHAVTTLPGGLARIKVVAQPVPARRSVNAGTLVDGSGARARYQ